MPNPPTFTPANKIFEFSVKFERSKAAGTLLIIWLNPRLAKKVLKDEFKAFFKKFCTSAIDEIFEVKIKNPANVKSRE